MGYRIEGALLMRDIMDGQLESADLHRIGRVADVEAEWRSDGSLHLTELLVGPAVLGGRVSFRLRGFLRRVLPDRMEHRVPVSEISEVGPTVRLRDRAEAYSVGGAEDWVAEHILRFIPGNGRGPR